MKNWAGRTVAVVVMAGVNKAVRHSAHTLFTGLLRFTRNDSRSRISVIASKRSDAWQSSLCYVARSAQNFYRGGAPAETDEL